MIDKISLCSESINYQHNNDSSIEAISKLLFEFYPNNEKSEKNENENMSNQSNISKLVDDQYSSSKTSWKLSSFNNCENRKESITLISSG